MMNWFFVVSVSKIEVFGDYFNWSFSTGLKYNEVAALQIAGALDTARGGLYLHLNLAAAQSTTTLAGFLMAASVYLQLIYVVTVCVVRKDIGQG